MKQAFTKADSAAVKGAAILMMMFHHLYLPGRFDDYAIDFWPIGENLVASMAWKCKICVSLFAFITGYGLLSSLKHSEKGMEHLASWTRVRLVKTMSGFWFIYAMAFAVTLCLDGLPLHQYGDKGVIVGVLYALADACGLANLFGSPTLCSTWWYMSAAIVFIVLFPILYAIAHRFGYIAAIAAVMAVPRLIGGGYPGGTNAITFVFPLLMGMMFSDLSLFERLDETTTRKSHAGTISLRVVPVCILTVIALLVPNSFRVQAWELSYGIVPVIVICFLRYCIIPIPGINAVLRFLGRHSMTIFLTHTFIRATYCEDFVYGTFDNFLAVYALLLVMSLALALAIDGLKKVCRYDHLVNRMIDRMNDALACDVGGQAH
ncbi:acyltransferase [Bifidobacterium pullorum subsp. saeculare]|uniref:Acyltransferase n=1 Tax=Bifidobacterium pullorum subsp. saeculare TaxID=78257 RepID=A0A938WXX3_9BIFI|nr:acyltransferase [Bifidobacterium pullorum]MBM6699053.1 acyltransferase [Bifidobacterium pullorum subsp. saeculare]